jgi:hypothetical protein
MKGRLYTCAMAGMLFLTSCTYSITMVHTEGSASDVVDETATATGTPTVEIPLIK